MLHLLKSPDAALARAVIDQHVRAGDHVSAVFLRGQRSLRAAAGRAVRRVGVDLSYAELLDLIFASDHVITW